MSILVGPHAPVSAKDASPKAGTAIFFAEYFPPYMGSDRRIFDLARSIQGWSIEFVITPPLRLLGGRHEKALHEYFQRHFVNAEVDDESGGIHGHYLTLPARLMSAWRNLPMPFAYALTVPYLVYESVAYLRRKRPNIVVLAHPSYLCGVVALIAAKILGLPTLLDYPDAWTPLAIETAGIPERHWMPPVLSWLEKFVARRADSIVSITQGLTKYIRSLGVSARIDVIPNGADESHFNIAKVGASRESLGLPRDADVILYSGRLEAWSGVHELVETIRVVTKKNPRAHFLFVGDGSAAAPFMSQVATANLDASVTFLGFQPFATMPALISACDVAIVPFPRTLTTEYCSPVKLFEYMLMRKAIITTDLPGIREAVTDQHVHFIRDLSSDELSQAIISILDDSQRRLGLEEHAFHRSLNGHRWSSLAANFAQCMEATAKVSR